MTTEANKMSNCDLTKDDAISIIRSLCPGMDEEDVAGIDWPAGIPISDIIVRYVGFEQGIAPTDEAAHHRGKEWGRVRIWAIPNDDRSLVSYDNNAWGDSCVRRLDGDTASSILAEAMRAD